MYSGIYSKSELQELIKPIVEKYGLRAVYLFGSYARGTATAKSDIDLIVDTQDAKMDIPFAMGALYNDLELAFKKKIDLITVRSLIQNTDRESDMLFRANVAKERVGLYGAF